MTEETQAETIARFLRERAALSVIENAQASRLQHIKATSWYGIPASLRALPHWGAYTESKKALTALGCREWSPKDAAQGEARGWDYLPKNPATWSSFEAICAAAQGRDRPIGPVLTLKPENNIVCIDFDDLEGKVPAGSANHAAMLRMMVIAEDEFRDIGTYGERSFSGRGAHIFAFGTLPVDRVNFKCGGHMAISGAISLTGDRLPGFGDELIYAQNTLDRMLAYLEKHNLIGSLSTGGCDGPVGEDGSRDDLSDDAIISRLLRFRTRMVDGDAVEKRSYAGTIYSGQPQSADHSRDTFILLGAIAKYSSNDEQVRRIFFGSPWMRNAGESHSGRCRWTKWDDIFETELAKARRNNAERWQAIERDEQGNALPSFMRKANPST